MTTTPTPQEAMKQAAEKLAHYAECQVKAFESGRPYLDMTLFPRLIADLRAALAASQPEHIFTLNGGLLSSQVTSSHEPQSVKAIVQCEIEAWSAVPQAQASIDAPQLAQDIGLLDRLGVTLIEPEVVAWIGVSPKDGRIHIVKEQPSPITMRAFNFHPLITLSSHREAMATLERHKKDWAESAHVFKQQRNEAREELEAVRRANVEAKTMWDMLKADYDAQREALAKKDAALDACVEALTWVIEQGGGPICEHEAGVCFCREKAAIAKAKEAKGGA